MMRLSLSSFLLHVGVAAFVGCEVNAFAVFPTSSASRYASSRLIRFMSDDGEPSDTASDGPVVAMDRDSFQEATPKESMVASVLNQLPGIGDVSADTRSAINEALVKLEAMNPTPDPATSPLLNGVWELRYAAGYSPEWTLPSPTRQLALFLYSGGYSPGVFALTLGRMVPDNVADVGDLEIAISRDAPRVDAKVPVKLFGGRIEQTISVKADLAVQTGIRLKETYMSATLMDRPFELPEKIRYSRDLYITYVDDDLLVVRDASGVPEVLVRKEKTFVENWGKEPSEVEDMAAPGEKD